MVRTPRDGTAEGPFPAPIRWATPKGPPRWPGGRPRFPIDASFYLAAVRGELAALIDEATAYRDLRGAMGRPLPAAAVVGGIHALAMGVVHYADGLASAVRESFGRDDPEARGALPALSIVTSRVHAALAAGSVASAAEALAEPEALATLRWGYGRLPAVAFDFDVAPEPAAPPAALARPNPTAPEPAPEPESAAPPEAPRPKAKRGGGRKPAYAPALQRRVCEAWASGKHASKAALADCFNKHGASGGVKLTADDVRRMLDNERNARKRAAKASDQFAAGKRVKPS